MKTQIKDKDGILNRMRKSLFCRHLLGGEKDTEFENFLNEAHLALLERDDYVGLAPCGSRFKGYATSASDFDVILIAGDGMCETENTLSSQLQRINKQFGKTGWSVPFCYDRKYFEVNLSTPTPSSGHVYDHAVWPLLYPLRGRMEVIQSLRKMARAKHQEYLSRWPGEAVKNLCETVSSLLYHEWDVFVDISKDGRCKLKRPQPGLDCPSRTLEKLFARGLSLDEVAKIIESRGHLWWLRTVEMLGHHA